VPTLLPHLLLLLLVFSNLALGPAVSAAQGSAALPGSVSLPQLLGYAEEHAPLLRVARSQRARARAAHVRAAVLLPSNPELSVAIGPRFERAPTGLDVEASLMQELEISGARSARRDAAARVHERTEAEIEQARWDLTCDVREAFRRALVEDQRVALEHQVLSFQGDVLRVVERQIHAGEIGPLSLRLAQAEVAQSQQLVAAAEQSLYSLRLRLAQLTGWPAQTPPVVQGSLEAPSDPPDLSALVKRAHEHLPQLRASAARAREAEAQLLVADREGWPKPSVGVQYQRESNRAMEGIYNIVMGAVSLPIPVFQTNQAARAEARADLEVTQAEWLAQSQLLSAQIAQARSELVAAAGRMQAYRGEILPHFEENLRLLARSFELGEIDLLALSAARERFLQIQADALHAQREYSIALSALERSIGQTLEAAR
jgi:cobalt-zinc-cadmium efflux system outer membrane protein